VINKGNQNAENAQLKILLPDGRWVEIKQPLLPIYDGDVWSDPLPVTQQPEYRALYARIHNSIVDAGYCGNAGSARFNFIFLNFTEHATGDFFDYNKLFIDREQIEVDENGKEITFCSYFGKAVRRTMLRYRDLPMNPRKTLVQDEALNDQMCRYSIAIKVFLVIGRVVSICP